MANFKALPIAAAVATALVAMSASAVDFHGYARAGLSTTADGGEQTCYGSGAGGHFVGRLGDECDTYVELSLTQEIFNKDGKQFAIEGMWATDIQNQGNDYQALFSDEDREDAREQGEPWSGGEFAFRQFYATGKGLVADGTVWMGKRYYQRKDVHWLDLFYVNNSGYGAGVEGISAGPGKFSFAWTNFDTPSRILNNNPAGENFDDMGTIQSNKLDVRYGGIPLWAGATLELIGIYGMTDHPEEIQDAIDDSGWDHGDDDGYFLTAEISHSLLGGFNKIVLQYGADSMGHAAWSNHGGGETLPNPWWGGQAEESYRILDWGVVKLGKQVDLGYSALYQVMSTYDTSFDDLTKLSIVVRPQFKYSDVGSVAVEVGYEQNEGYPWEYEGDSYDLSKIMVSHNWSPLANGGFWARPQLRVYTGAFYGDVADARDDEGDFRLGAQVEAWW